MLDVKTTAPTPLIEIEADRRVMYSDDYFGLVPGVTRKVVVTSLEAPPVASIRVTLACWGQGAAESVTLT